MKSGILPGLLIVLAMLSTLTGCAVNPVTGERQLALIPESQELSLGAEQYVPTQQTQGGRFYLDPELTVYVREVGMKMARVSDRPDLPYEFVVLNSSDPMPGPCLAARSQSTVVCWRSWMMKLSWLLYWAMRSFTLRRGTACNACSKAC